MGLLSSNEVRYRGFGWQYLCSNLGSPGQFIYWDHFYHDLYTNRAFLMGNWVGRDGAGIRATSRYWLSARNAIQFGYRHAKVDALFVSGGGTVNDTSERFDFWILGDWRTSAFVQYEQWKFPLLASALQKNVTTSVQVHVLAALSDALTSKNAPTTTNIRTLQFEFSQW